MQGLRSFDMAAQRALVALLVACALAGCGGGSRAPVAHSRSANIAWLRVYGRWYARLRSDVGAAERVRASLLIDDSRAGEFAVAVNRVSTCGDRYRRRVGTPSNPAWRRPAALALQVCRGYADGEQKLLGTIGKDAGDLRFSGEAAIAKAGERQYLLNQAFQRSFVWNRRLPRIAVSARAAGSSRCSAALRARSRGDLSRSAAGRPASGRRSWRSSAPSPRAVRIPRGSSTAAS
jgi:hypothetical protein